LVKSHSPTHNRDTDGSCDYSSAELKVITERRKGDENKREACKTMKLGTARQLGLKYISVSDTDFVYSNYHHFLFPYNFFLGMTHTHTHTHLQFFDFFLKFAPVIKSK